MNKSDIIKFCKDLGCCDACCLRYLGLKNPTAYENAKFVLKYQNIDSLDKYIETNKKIEEKPEQKEDAPQNNCKSTEEDGSEVPLAKRCKTEGACVSCLGILQPDTWPQCFDMVKQELDKKRYECNTFACALSAPIATILRERVIALRLAHRFPDYDANVVTALKEAWKWSSGAGLSARAGRPLHSGAVAPLLVSVHIDYPDDLQELEILKALSPSLFESRSKQRRRFAVEFTRRSVEQALGEVSLASLAALAGAGGAGSAWAGCVPAPAAAIRCVSVVCAHTPLYLAGRYLKLSRSLPQTPWLVGGRRMLHSSVQEIIFQPIADVYGMAREEGAARLKFVSAGREDVDVRCLGAGRPFAVEITDPRRELTPQELDEVCKQISSSGDVIVSKLVYVSREELAQLKQGEETKSKTYTALCVKLLRAEDQASGYAPTEVSEQDVCKLNSFRNTADGSAARVALAQRTPLRVLHRRPLLTRTRHVLQLRAEKVPGHPQLVLVRAETEAGTYVKEWVHGDNGRTAPALGAALGPRVKLDMLALDVARVHLSWPPRMEATGAAQSDGDTTEQTAT